jgi:ABC-type branched-subunit amino acid transport system ATPase component
VNHVLEVSDLRVAYGGVHAVNSIGLSVGRGRCTVLIGANGAGKTSTLRAIGGLIPARGGTVTLEGRILGGLEAAARARLGLGHVLEGRHVFPRLTVRQNLELGALAAGRHRRPLELDDVFDLLPELHNMLEKPAGSLSGGQQQLLAMGRSLVGNPSVAMLDEPTTGLAPRLVDRVIEIVAGMRARGLAVLLVEQRLEVAQAVGDDVHILRHGEIVHTTTGDDDELAGRVHDAYLG